jgi:paraquat-inducible protein B
MSEEVEASEAKITRLRSISMIWLVPFIALFIGIWMIYVNWSHQGPVIVISFSTGDGIESGKTKIKVKNVDIGKVESLQLKDGSNGVAVYARIENSSTHLLNEDTQFWVVRPRIGKDGITGLGTLLSGAYIELSPGTSDIKTDEFAGLENEPVTPSGTLGVHITLESSGYRALQIGDPILFRGIDVGKIEYVYFNAEERTVYYDAFILAPYDKLVTGNIKFWEVNGFEVNLSANGIRIQTGTIETMISGGVTFDLPKDLPPGNMVTERAVFEIYPNKEAIYESHYKHEMHYVLLFKNSIRGLNTGAPVEYRGVKVGRVIRTDVTYSEIVNVLDKKTKIPVMISIAPSHMGYKDEKSELEKAKKEFVNLLKRGLRGELVTGNLLTGNKYIELQYEEGVINDLETFSGYTVVPTLESQFDKTINKIGKVIDKLYNLPLESAVISMDETLKEFKNMAAQLEILLKQSSDKHLVSNISGAFKNIETITADFSEGTLTHKELQDTMRSLKNTLKELKPLLRQLNKKPNSLIFSSEKNMDIEPQGKK